MKRKFSQKILISTNSSCNLKCIYCFEKNKSHYEFDVAKAVEIIGKLLSVKTEFGTKIKIHGGEPFLVFDKIKLLCDTIWQNNYPEYYQFHITTNGTLIHGEIQDWLLKNKERVILKLSIDGDKKSNDINRPKSFELIDFHFLITTWPSLVASMTITPQTLPYFYENIRFLNTTGFKNIIFQFSLLTDWHKYDLKDEFNHQMMLLVDYYLNNPKILPCFSWLNIEKILEAPKPLCGIGRMHAYDFQSEQYYPCQMCFPSACGNRISAELNNINFSDPAIVADDVCGECPFVNLCITCYAENYISRGSANKRDMNICDYQRILFAAIIKFEYARIFHEKNPSTTDILKMKAIQKILPQLQNIER